MHHNLLVFERMLVSLFIFACGCDGSMQVKFNVFDIFSALRIVELDRNRSHLVLLDDILIEVSSVGTGPRGHTQRILARTLGVLRNARLAWSVSGTHQNR